MSKKKAPKKSRSGSKQFESSLRNDILLIVLFALCLFLFLCCFGVCGIVGNVIADVIFGVFGLTSFLLPWFLFAGLFVLINDKGENLSILKFVSGAFFTIFLSAFFWLISPDFNLETNILDYYGMSVNTKGYGGFLGGCIARFLTTFMGQVGAFIMVILIMVIAVIIIYENSSFKKDKKASESIFSGFKDSASNARRDHDIRKDKRRLRRAEERVRREEEWEAERIRRQEELVKRREELEAGRNSVTFDTKILPPGELPPVKAQVPETDKPAAEERVIKDAPRRSDRTLTVEQSISSQNVTEIIIDQPDDAFIPEPTVEEVVPQPVDIPEEVPEVKPPEFKILEHEPEEPAPNPEPVQRPIIDEPMDEPVMEEEPVIAAEPQVEEEPVSTAPKVSEEEEPDTPKAEVYQFPPINLLKKGSASGGDSKKSQNETAQLLVDTLESFGVTVKLLDVSCGPTVTRYELEPDKGVKVSKIISLADDIKLKLAAPDIRIEAPIPGKAAIGIEVPNKHNVSVMLRDLLESEGFKNSASKLTFAVGKDIGGNVIVSDIAKMPHLLIAGATGSGKSVCLNTLIMSILYKAEPSEVKLIMIDPKVVELSIYNGIPHLMIPVVTDPKKASGALNWAVTEMTNRYKSFADNNVRDIKGYNQRMAEMKKSPDYDPILHAPLPQILIAVDELADLMMVAPREVEDSICRLAQLARAAGIHLIIATQRPSVDVITGLIKANMPSRLALAVSSGVDSRTIIDMNGAEKLLGNGDMLFYPQGYQKPLRVQGAFVSDQEVGAVAEFLKGQAKGVEYNSDIEEQIMSSSGSGGIGGSSDKDELFVEAAQLIIENNKASIGMLQRKLRIGFNRAARIMDQLSDAGVVGPEEGTKPRTVLMSMEQFEQYIEESF